MLRGPFASSHGDNLPSLVSRRAPSALPLVLAAAAVFACGACGPTAVCKTVGINDGSNRTMRRQILSYGLGEFCKQMLSRNAPLKMTDDSPIIGRYYPTACHTTELPNGDLQMDFDGFGYAWTNVSQKLTFTSSGSVEYNQDFRCSDDNAIYAYFPVRQVRGSNFQTHIVEQKLASLAPDWVKATADKMGSQLVSGKLGEGFTVIQDSDNQTDFDLGIIPLGQKPQHPFRVAGGSKVTYENARTQIAANERDFIGPIRLEKSGVITLTVTLEGQPAIDVFVIPKDEADAALHWYFDYGDPTKLAAEPRIQGVAQQGLEYRQTVPLPTGIYYVVLDNTALAGQAAPQGPSAAAASYIIQYGDAP
jgi:hypothetical protein